MNEIQNSKNKKNIKNLKKICEEISLKKIKETLKLKNKLEFSINLFNKKILGFEKEKKSKKKKITPKKKIQKLKASEKKNAAIKKNKNHKFLFLNKQKICICKSILNDELIQCTNPYVF